MNVRPKPSHTYTVVQMPLPAEMYAYIREKLMEHGYGHAVDDLQAQIDMHGIALVPDQDTKRATIQVFVQDGKASHPASSGPRLDDGFHLFQHVRPLLTLGSNADSTDAT